MYVADVYFTKEVEKDNYEKGCYGDRSLIFDKRFTIKFKNTEHLKVKLAEWLQGYFDVNKDTFVKYVENEIEANRFDYSQNEDIDGIHMNITKDSPDGYLADYTFYIDNVYEEIDYNF